MKTGRKISGGRYHQARKKKKYGLASQARIVRLGKEKRKNLRIRGGREKTFLLTADMANILDKKTKKASKVKILNVIETPANKFLARQNIIIKGAIIDTEKGKARVTNRPSQEGNVQAVLLEEK